MSNTGFPFGGNNTNFITGANPALILSGTETNGAWDSVQEVAGVLWFTINAWYNGTTWVQINQLAPSYAMTLNASVAGQLSFYSAAAVGGSATSVPITWVPGGGQLNTGYSFQRNKFINGSFNIDQRGNGAIYSTSVVGVLTYTVDRWFYGVSTASKFTLQQGGASGYPIFNNYLDVASTSAYTPVSSDYFYFGQRIEAQNIVDLGLGSGAIKSFTVSFWAYSTIGGTFSLAFINSPSTRSYVTTYTLPAAAWTYVTITVPVDTTGTWVYGGTGNGLGVYFDLGSGSTYTTSTTNVWQNGAYFRATGSTALVSTSGAYNLYSGVQLESGSQATPFEQRLFGAELALCQRYFCKTYDQTVAVGAVSVAGALGLFASLTFNNSIFWQFPVTMRTDPTVATYSPHSGASGFWYNASSTSDIASGGGFSLGTNGTNIYETATVAAGQELLVHATASAEI